MAQEAFSNILILLFYEFILSLLGITPSGEMLKLARGGEEWGPNILTKSTSL